MLSQLGGLYQRRHFGLPGGNEMKKMNRVNDGFIKKSGRGGWVLLIFLSMLSACAGENGTNGVDGANGVNGTNASIQTGFGCGR